MKIDNQMTCLDGRICITQLQCLVNRGGLENEDSANVTVVARWPCDNKLAKRIQPTDNENGTFFCSANWRRLFFEQHSDH
jgi:hypothetical protein